MKRTVSDILNKAREKASNSRGMTMAEMIIAVAIIIILAGVAFISVIQYQRMLAQLERDKVAKDIFFAAQNHLIAARGEGYLELGINADIDPKTVYGIHEDKDVYYFVHTPGSNDVNDPDSILNLMLPFGAIDETVRGGESYVVRYNRITGQVLDVFYCTASGSRFGYDLLGDVSYSSLISESTENGYYGDPNKARRRNNFNGNKSVLGWYGGDSAEYGTPKPLEAPSIEVINGDTLKVKVTDNVTNAPSFGYSIKLIITGKSSGAKKAYVLKNSGSEAIGTSERIKATNPYEVILDDITSEGLHFGSIVADTDEKFIPGEDISIQAVAYSLGGLATIEYSAEKVTNSLFASIGDDLNGGADGKPDTAYISSIRHLENLDARISNYDAFDGTGADRKLMISDAVQTTDLDWNDFLSNEDVDNKSVTYSTGTGGSYDPADNKTNDNCYKPIVPPTLTNGSDVSGLNYDGKMFSITGIKVQDTSQLSQDAGLFQSFTGGSVRDLELIDFDIESKPTQSAGALAGTIEGTTITNVLARNTNNTTSTTATVKAGNVGGLVGNMLNGTIRYSAADLIVNGASTAGGLVGTATSGKVDGCYSAGHTKDGSYLDWIYTDGDKTKSKVSGHDYDVIGPTAGGLIGNAGSAEISNSYSTCSVSGTTAGGFVGSASGEVSNCYATGLIDTNYITEDNATTNKTIGAFAGTFSGTIPDNKDCHYFSIINEVMLKKGNDVELDHYLGAVGDDDKAKIKAIDENTSESDAYDKFVGGKEDWNPAEPYDDTLETYYNKKYNLRTVEQLSGAGTPTGYVAWTDLFINSHFGDWPAPEVFIVNE